MDYKWLGPYTIVKSLGKGLYALEAADNPGGVIDRVHAWHTVKAIFISITFCVS